MFHPQEYREDQLESKFRWYSTGSIACTRLRLKPQNSTHLTSTQTQTLTYVAHATLHSLRFTVRNAFARFTFSAFLTICVVGHRRALRTIGPISATFRFLFASSVLRFSAFHLAVHVLTVLTTRWILVAAHRLRSQFTIFIAACVVVFRAQKAGVTLFVTLHTQVATKTLLGLRETTARFGLKDFSYRAQTARRKSLKLR